MRTSYVIIVRSAGVTCWRTLRKWCIAPKRRDTTLTMWLRIDRSASTMIPRSRTDDEWWASKTPTVIDPEWSWHRRYAVKRQSNSVLLALSCRRLNSSSEQLSRWHVRTNNHHNSHDMARSAKKCRVTEYRLDGGVVRVYKWDPKSLSIKFLHGKSICSCHNFVNNLLSSKKNKIHSAIDGARFRSVTAPVWKVTSSVNSVSMISWCVQPMSAAGYKCCIV